MEFEGRFVDLLHPYALLIGVFNLSIFTMHGSIYLYLKTEGELQQRVRGWILRTVPMFVVLYVISTIFTLAQVPSMVENFETYPIMWVVVILNVLAIANIPRALYLEQPGMAFFSSCCAIAALIVLFGMGVFPSLIRSSLDPAWSL